MLQLPSIANNHWRWYFPFALPIAIPSDHYYNILFRWIIDPPLEVTVPAKRTPWPDAPPELPSNVKEISIQEHTEKRHAKSRASRSKHSSRSKRKHESRTADPQVSSKVSEEWNPVEQRASDNDTAAWTLRLPAFSIYLNGVGGQSRCSHQAQTRSHQLESWPVEYLHLGFHSVPSKFQIFFFFINFVWVIGILVFMGEVHRSESHCICCLPGNLYTNSSSFIHNLWNRNYRFVFSCWIW